LRIRQRAHLFVLQENKVSRVERLVCKNGQQWPEREAQALYRFNSVSCIRFSSQTRLVDTDHKRVLLRQKPATRAGRAHPNAGKQG
jgi:hypothetical protein